MNGMPLELVASKTKKTAKFKKKMLQKTLERLRGHQRERSGAGSNFGWGQKQNDA